MFGLSLTKILFTIIVVLIVWYGFKWMNRVQDQRREASRIDPKKPSAAAGSNRSTAAADEVEEMVKCAVCGDYVSQKGAVNCGRDGCPYPG